MKKLITTLSLILAFIASSYSQGGGNGSKDVSGFVNYIQSQGIANSAIRQTCPNAVGNLDRQFILQGTCGNGRFKKVVFRKANVLIGHVILDCSNSVIEVECYECENAIDMCP